MRGKVKRAHSVLLGASLVSVWAAYVFPLWVVEHFSGQVVVRNSESSNLTLDVEYTFASGVLLMPVVWKTSGIELDTFQVHSSILPEAFDSGWGVTRILALISFSSLLGYVTLSFGAPEKRPTVSICFGFIALICNLLSWALYAGVGEGYSWRQRCVFEMVNCHLTALGFRTQVGVASHGDLVTGLLQVSVDLFYVSFFSAVTLSALLGMTLATHWWVLKNE